MYNHPKVVYKDENANKSNSVLRYIGNRVLRNNRNFLCALTGQTGVGKSWASGSIAESYSKMFDIPYDVDKHMHFSLKGLLTVINNRKENDIRFGSILQYDESQVEANSRNWQAQTNKILSALVSTFRNQRLIVLFPTPKLEFLDRQTRMLFHAEFKVMGFDKTTKKTTIWPRFLTDWNVKKDRPYSKRLIVKYKAPDRSKLKAYKVHDWQIDSPSDEWIRKYEIQKKTFTDKLNKELLEKLQPKEKAEDKGTKSLPKIAELYEQYGEDYVTISKYAPNMGLRALKDTITMIKRSIVSGKPILST